MPRRDQMAEKKGARLLAQVKKKRQAQHDQNITKVVKKKHRRTNFDKVNFNG